MATLDGADWCQLITIVAIPTILSLVGAVTFLYRALQRNMDSHLKDLRALALSAKARQESK